MQSKLWCIVSIMGSWGKSGKYGIVLLNSRFATKKGVLQNGNFGARPFCVWKAKKTDQEQPSHESMLKKEYAKAGREEIHGQNVEKF